MRVRRRFASGFHWRNLVAWFRPSAGSEGQEAATDGEVGRNSSGSSWRRGKVAYDAGQPIPTPPSAQREGEWTPAKSTVVGDWRRRLRELAPRFDSIANWWRSPWALPSLFALFLIAGYLFAALFLFPAPFFTATRTIPAVIGSEREGAEQALESAGFSVARVQGESHPTVPRGVVVWQDPPADIVAPEGSPVELVVSTGPQQIPVPDVIGYESALARQLIEASGLTIARVESVQTAVPKDVSVSTRPTAGATLRPGDAVTLVVSLGAPTIRIPQLAGLTIEEAQDSLMAVGLTLGTFWRETSSAYPEGTVMRTEPPIGTLTAPETAVNIVVARSP